ncbi:Pulcherriminic acid synthase [Ascidiaceihabitans donghaensis]|uniref:Pulcherriminic acid synthase n=1 Tax=Ascidiaceihabitans donghaensis TaxID=1510460 RepID=A0A2R8BGE9_9RHOB|nr:cytochrome P450 [Ascidiaceihabitans donghaensis]SPH22203.1 Pulcherriminic acid synthase [Ascidiaceihabitans donghaensis]
MVAVFTNVFTTAFRIIQVVLEAFLALGWLILNGAKAAMGGGIATFATSAGAQRRVFAILRAFVPNFTLNKVLMKAYDNTGTAVVSRRVDVLDVLNRNDDFEVVYGTRMRKLTEGENFFLGMQPGWDYTRDTSAMRLAARMDDVSNIVLPRATERASDIVKASGGKIDIVPALTLEVPWDMTATYFGAGGERNAMQEWTTDLFWYLFEDLPADPELDAKAMKYAGELRDYLDGLIKDRKANPTDAEDILNRCLALQSADTPGMSDLGIRNNMLGILIGAIPTISKACCLALDELLNRPDALATAHKAALAGDDALLAMHIWEALRFNPHNPVIYRRATRDAIVGRSTLRQRTIKKGQIVFAGTASAQFDRYDIPTPNQFRTDRPFEDYIIWGYGMHNCFGAAINAAVIPAILKPLLAQKNLRRAAGAAGQIDGGGTPHPQHFHVEFDT